MQLISKLAIFAGSVSGISALSVVFAYSQSPKSIETKEEVKLTLDKEKVATEELDVQTEVEKGDIELSEEDQEEIELCLL